MRQLFGETEDEDIKREYTIEKFMDPLVNPLTATKDPSISFWHIRKPIEDAILAGDTTSPELWEAIQSYRHFIYMDDIYELFWIDDLLKAFKEGGFRDASN